MWNVNGDELVIAGVRIPKQVVSAVMVVVAAVLGVVGALGIQAAVTAGFSNGSSSGDNSSQAGSSGSDSAPVRTVQLLYAGAFDLGAVARQDPALVTEFGGLSGIDSVGEGAGQRFIAISDDKGDFGPVRAYYVRQQSGNGDVSQFSVDGKLVFTRADGSEYAAAGEYIDAEEIRVLPNGNFLWTTEGRAKGSVVPPMLIESAPNGKEIRRIAVPAHHVPSGNGSYGVKDNEGPEAMAVIPGMDTAVTINEDALAQDRGRLARMTFYDLITGTAVKEFAVPVSIGRGIASVVADEEGVLYMLERGFNPVTKKNTASIYRLNTEGAQDVLDTSQLSGREPAVRKELVLQLPGHPDNVEGLAWSEGALLVVSDNNFNPQQRTLVHTLRRY
ncbi:esterase-like activity of phytase family protein [Corynebacterium aquatimens]|uniref:Phytase-like domain-containing protein n=1 Tax=Corynebacterium aquatimens TaxID=1190508 RepID=A0A931GTH4_9CORY|nr:esterase-like activity of phytase family protein [Corynebacterium aquatimens]MBG6123012.1 hypothetical protein [Corynebacterium aquatimens]WJY66654.1 hypothetical protein CAQUA_09835 [Corynebacterium aquatimens]